MKDVVPDLLGELKRDADKYLPVSEQDLDRALSRKLRPERRAKSPPEALAKLLKHAVCVNVDSPAALVTQLSTQLASQARVEEKKPQVERKARPTPAPVKLPPLFKFRMTAQRQLVNDALEAIPAGSATTMYHHHH